MVLFDTIIDIMIQKDDYSKNDFDIINLVYSHESKFTKVFNNNIKRFGVFNIINTSRIRTLATKFSKEYVFSKKALHDIQIDNPQKYYNILKLYMLCQLYSITIDSSPFQKKYFTISAEGINKDFYLNIHAIRSDYVYKEIYFMWVEYFTISLKKTLSATGYSLSEIYNSLSPSTIYKIINQSMYEEIKALNSNIYYSQYLRNDLYILDAFKFNSTISKAVGWILEEHDKSSNNNLEQLNFIADKILGTKYCITTSDLNILNTLYDICNKITPEQYPHLSQEACAIMYIFDYTFPYTLIGQEYIAFTVKSIISLYQVRYNISDNYVIYNFLLKCPHKIYVDSDMIADFIMKTRYLNTQDDYVNDDYLCNILFFLLHNNTSKHIFDAKNCQDLIKARDEKNSRMRLNKLYSEILMSQIKNINRDTITRLKSYGFEIDNEERFY